MSRIRNGRTDVQPAALLQRRPHRRHRGWRHETYSRGKRQIVSKNGVVVMLVREKFRTQDCKLGPLRVIRSPVDVLHGRSTPFILADKFRPLYSCGAHIATPSGPYPSEIHPPPYGDINVFR